MRVAERGTPGFWGLKNEKRVLCRVVLFVCLVGLSRHIPAVGTPTESAFQRGSIDQGVLGALGNCCGSQAIENATAMSFKIKRLANRENTAVLRVCGRRAKLLFTGTLKNG